MPQPQMRRVNSSYVESVGYDAEREQLYVAYKSQKGRSVLIFTARYDDVPLAMYQDFLAAPSKGKWALKHLHPLRYVAV
jgi:hypothetical protein